MADYIEREYVLKCMEDSYKNAGISAEAASKVRKWLYKAPATDVRPVVLCKDCKHYEQLDLFRNSPAWSGMCHYWNSHATREDGFCFKAAKKEET